MGRIKDLEDGKLDKTKFNKYAEGANKSRKELFIFLLTVSGQLSGRRQLRLNAGYLL